MKRLGTLVLFGTLAVGLVTFVSQTGQANAKGFRSCGNVHTPAVAGSHLETGGHFACTGAKKVVRKYFDMVGESAETNGGCAQKRFAKGCKVNRYRCTTSYSGVDNSLQGECSGPKGYVVFLETDIGPR